jgi:hypothetical protein
VGKAEGADLNRHPGAQSRLTLGSASGRGRTNVQLMVRRTKHNHGASPTLAAVGF